MSIESSGILLDHYLRFAGLRPELYPKLLRDEPGLKLYAGTGNRPLSQEIASLLDRKLHEPVVLFPDSERRATIAGDLTDCVAFIIQSPSSPHVNDHIMETCLMADAARRAGARTIVAVLPYFPYTRGDRPEPKGTAISAKLIVNLLCASGVNRLVTFDLHTEQELGFFDGPWTNLYASNILVPAIQKLSLNNPMMVSPDLGAVKRTNAWSQLLGIKDIVVCYKQRDMQVDGSPKILYMIGDVRDRDVIIADDELGTGGTIETFSNLVQQNGARKIYVVVVHGKFSGNALEIISRSPVEKVITTNSLDHRPEVLQHPKVQIVSLAPLIAETISDIYQKTVVTKY